MSFARAVFWNTAIQTAGKAASTLLGLAVLAVMTRSLGPDDFGAYSIATSFLQFFAIIADFGLILTANRMLGEASAMGVSPERAREEESRIMSNIITMRLCSAIVMFVLAPLAAFFFFPYSLEVKEAIAIAVFSFLAIAMAQTLVPLFQKHLRMEKAALAELAGRVALLAGVGVCAWRGLGILWYMGAIVFGSAVHYFFLRSQAGVFIRLYPAFDFSLWRRIFSMSWPIGISIIFNLAYLKADTIFLSVLRPEAEVGFYGAAYRVLDILTGLATLFMGLILPAMTAAWVARHTDRFRVILEKAFDAVSLAAFPTVAIGVALGRPVMAFVAGKDFSPAGDILAVLILAMGAVFFSTLFGHTVVALNKQRTMIWGYALDAAVSLAAYAIFIPRYGIWGAAWTTVFSEIIMVALTVFVVISSSHVRPRFGVFFKSFASALLAGAVMVALREVHWIPALGAGVVVYGAGIVLTGAMRREFLADIFHLRST